MDDEAPQSAAGKTSIAGTHEHQQKHYDGRIDFKLLLENSFTML